MFLMKSPFPDVESPFFQIHQQTHCIGMNIHLPSILGSKLMIFHDWALFRSGAFLSEGYPLWSSISRWDFPWNKPSESSVFKDGKPPWFRPQRGVVSSSWSGHSILVVPGAADQTLIGKIVIDQLERNKDWVGKLWNSGEHQKCWWVFNPFVFQKAHDFECEQPHVLMANSQFNCGLMSNSVSWPKSSNFIRWIHP